MNDIKHQCIVIIPIYQKRKLNEYERLSFINTIDKFKSLYDIEILTYKSFNIDQFYTENNIDEKYKINYIYYDDTWFINTKTYDDLLLLDSFYLDYKKYQNMLIVQTDAYIFDQYKIFKFLNMGYGFIGAPVVLPNHSKCFYWYKRGIYYNGGLSLRNIQFCLDCIKDKEYIEYFFKYNEKDEDIYFSHCVQESYKSPTFLEALSFSMDNQIWLYTAINNFEKPFGIHHYWNDDDNGDNKLQYMKDLKWIN